MSDTWTIGELAERAALALRASPDGAPLVNGRVRDVPGERLIRWYTTIGLVDPPLTRRGRIAQYGRRHLLQLVAVKRLQAAGRSIAEIQTALAGATDRMLETAAALEPAPGVAANPAPGTAAVDTPPSALPPDRAHAPGHGHVPSHGPTSGAPEQGAADAADDRQGGARADGESGRSRFWAQRPGQGNVGPSETAGQPPDAPGTVPRGVVSGVTGAAPGSVPSGASGKATGGVPEGRGGAVVVGVRLGGGVRLVLDAGRVPSEEDVQAVLAAAGPLLAVLEERELI
ncbi:MerR family transcriptional regulator [Nonomuraea sp. NPDC005650]|uniref:MerR family transcriptional regulator n=1 Tax=Nonomuraea sp. NPDC005650 TaxID=3157045 RepID=UPI0033A0951A